ncbi:MAG TPA: serine/threonine-protein kinase, partial [Polyangiaceae bacterium]
ASPMSRPASPSLAEGDLFLGTYRVLREIGRGGMGAVYEVIDELGTQHRFALKVLDPNIASNSEFRKRFAAEARITANVSSNHVAKVIRTGLDNDTGLSYIVMELIRGTDLGGRISPGRGLSPEYALMLLRQVASALDTLHRHGIVHRDLKPANLVVALTDDLVPVLKIVDFGIAKCVAEHVAPVTTACLGTVPYQAPEQMMGDRQIGPAADRYALAHVAFTLLTGQPYWLADRGDHSTAAKIFQTMRLGECILATARIRLLNEYLEEVGGAQSQLSLPAEFDRWFAKATAFSPEQRFASAREMIDELARSLEPILRGHDGEVLAINELALGVAEDHRDESMSIPSASGAVLRSSEGVIGGTEKSFVPPVSASTMSSVKHSTKLWVPLAVLCALGIVGVSGWWVLGAARRGNEYELRPVTASRLDVLAEPPSAAAMPSASSSVEVSQTERPSIGIAVQPTTLSSAPMSLGTADAPPTSPRATGSKSAQGRILPLTSTTRSQPPQTAVTSPSIPNSGSVEPPTGAFR